MASERHARSSELPTPPSAASATAVGADRPLAGHADGPARGARAPLPHRSARVREHRQGFLRSGTSTSCASTSSSRRAATGGSAARAAGLFLAMSVLRPARPSTRTLGEHPLPQDWYIPSDGILDFIRHNDLEDVYNRKYVDIDQVRLEYPYIVQLFKNSFFSPDILRGLSVALTISTAAPSSCAARACSRTGWAPPSPASTRASSSPTGGPSASGSPALTRRDRRGLRLDLQPRPDRVPGRARPHRPARGDGDHDPGGGRGAGRALLAARLLRGGLHENEFRWSPRIQREDGLLRMVPGLGTRAVDRLADDYPVLLAPASRACGSTRPRTRW